MSILKKILQAKISIIILGAVLFVVVLILIVPAIAGVSIGYEEKIRQASEIRGSNTIINNQIYAPRYKNILNENLINKGYVSLERLVFYLQRKHNVLDITTLSDLDWLNSYDENLDVKHKQMIPIKTICKKLKTENKLLEFNKQSGLNSNGVYIEVIDLCNIDGIDITTSNKYSENYSYLPYVFPLQSDFVITSIVLESRSVDLGLSGNLQDAVNFHNGWDFSVPIGTNFYSICDGKVSNIINTQFNDLSFKESGNKTGNYIIINCNNGLIANYLHIQANSSPINIKVGSSVKIGDLLGRTSSTGLSTGPHLHLGLKTQDGKDLDALEYIDFDYKEG